MLGDPFLKPRIIQHGQLPTKAAVFLNPEARVSGKAAGNTVSILRHFDQPATQPNEFDVLSQGAHGDWKDDLKTERALVQHLRQMDSRRAIS